MATPTQRAMGTMTLGPPTRSILGSIATVVCAPAFNINKKLGLILLLKTTALAMRPWEVLLVLIPLTLPTS